MPLYPISSITSVKSTQPQSYVAKKPKNNSEQGGYLPKDAVALNAHRNMLSSTISFGRSKAEHAGYGANIDQARGKTSFKVKTYPSTQRMFVEVTDASNFINIINKTETEHNAYKLTPEAKEDVKRLIDVKQRLNELKQALKQNPKSRELKAQYKAMEAGRDDIRKPYNLKSDEYDARLKIAPRMGSDGMPTSYVKGSKMFELKHKGEGIFEGEVDSKLAKAGQMYRLVMLDNNGKVTAAKDPYSNLQESIFSWSTIYDHSNFKWSDNLWQNCKNAEKISGKAEINGLTSKNAMNLYEMHIGTLTKEGTFEAAKEQLDKISDLGFNAIHIMPVEGCYDDNWGYDGVDKFAVSKKYGGPNKLKELVDYAHSKSINVIMDVVPNHIGPQGNMLADVGPYAGDASPWGDMFNLEGYDSREVRDFLVNQSLHFLKNYHVDGLRLDMTKHLESDFTLKQIATEVHYHYPDAILIAEDGREDEEAIVKTLTKPLSDGIVREGKTETEHCDAVNSLDHYTYMKDLKTLDALGFDLQWGFNFHHFLAGAVLGGWNGNGRYDSNLNNLLGIAKANENRLKYIKSHDEIGNMDGTRLIHKSIAQQMRLFNKTEGKDDCERGQRAAQAAYQLAKLVATGEIDNITQDEFNKLTKNTLHINREISIEKELKPAFENAVNKHKAALGFTYTTPGPVMIFQGDECANLDAFRFFRTFPNKVDDFSDLHNKGYEPGESAKEASTLGNIQCNKKTQELMDKISNYTKALNSLAKTNPALTDGYIADDSIAHEASEVIGVHTVSKDGKNEIYAITNFKKEEHPKNAEGYDDSFDGYQMEFPEGKWEVLINSDEEQYGGSGKYVSKKKIIDTKLDGKKPAISLPANGTVIYKRVG